MKPIKGFSKLSKMEKINWLLEQLPDSRDFIEKLTHFWDHDDEYQKRFEEFSENTLSNFDLPYGIAPNFLINDHIYSVPMVIEESSVVAAASLGAKFWLERGGFHSKVLSTTKVGHVHFKWHGDKKNLTDFFHEKKHDFLNTLSPLCLNMDKRGGGIVDLKLIDKTYDLEGYFQLKLEVKTCDAMGANFINSLLEELAEIFKSTQRQDPRFPSQEEVQIIMCILSNYTPDCVVKTWVECPIENLGEFPHGMSSEVFSQKFATAVEIARVDPFRAVTHNKGIMNGIDSVVLATGNDFRAIEACAHAYAARDGQYRSLTHISSEHLKEGLFHFSLEIPLAVGTVGGLTSLHPLAQTSLAILENPSAQELMKIMGSVGLSQNFGALRSLVTTGIQKGHMKLHLLNIFNQLNATADEIKKGKEYFSDKVVSFNGVRDFLESMRASQRMS